MARMSRIPKPPEMPYAYRQIYWGNWWHKLTKRKPKHPDAKANCVSCGVEGILGYELTHRGDTRPTNLFCLECHIKAGGTHAVRGLKADKASGGGASRSKRVRGRRP